MSLNQNQFSMISVQGDLDLQFTGGVISCRVSANQSGNLVAGQAVKMDTTVNGGAPALLGLAANSDQSFGFVIRTLKDQSFAPGNAVEIAIQGSVMQMTASGTITRGAKVEVVQSTNTVITSAGTNPIVGFALDNGTTGNLLRVYIITQSVALPATIGDVAGLQTALNAREQVMVISVSEAQLNAGQVLIPGVGGQAITVTGLSATFTGTFATGTAMVVESTNGTPVAYITETLAGMAAGTIVAPDPHDTHQTLGAGVGVPLGTGDGLQVVHTGSAFTGGTAINFLISYVQQ
jgi:hypothetical protein